MASPSMTTPSPVRSRPAAAAGATAEGYRVPRLSVAAAARARAQRPGPLGENGALRAWLGYTDLDDLALTAVLAGVGAAGVAAATGNPRLSPEMWRAVYDAAPACGRLRLVQARLLSADQRHHIVHSAHERSPLVLEYIAHQLDAGELSALATRPLAAAARAVLTRELAARRDGTPPFRRPDGSGRTTFEMPGPRVPSVARLDVAGQALDDGPSRFAEAHETSAWADRVTAYLTQRLGELPASAWYRLGRTAINGRQTWASATETALRSCR